MQILDKIMLSILFISLFAWGYIINRFWIEYSFAQGALNKEISEYIRRKLEKYPKLKEMFEELKKSKKIEIFIFAEDFRIYEPFWSYSDKVLYLSKNYIDDFYDALQKENSLEIAKREGLIIREIVRAYNDIKLGIEKPWYSKEDAISTAIIGNEEYAKREILKLEKIIKEGDSLSKEEIEILKERLSGVKLGNKLMKLSEEERIREINRIIDIQRKEDMDKILEEYNVIS